MASEAWAESWSLVLDQYRQISLELAELDAAIAQTEGTSMIGQFSSASERDQAVKMNTADLRRDRARLQGQVWVVKAEMELLAALFGSDVPYYESIDPARNYYP